MNTVNEEIYQKKIEGCKILSEKNVKRINRTHILSVAETVGLSLQQMETAWNNFVQSGGKFVDNRNRTSMGSTSRKFPTNTKIGKSKYVKGLRRKVSAKEARKILLEYLTSEDSLVKVSHRNNIDYNLVYSWIRELTVSGTVCGDLILDFKKYAKLPIIDVFYFYKHPNTKRASIANLTPIEKNAYNRVANVLLNYLPVKD